MGRVAQTELSEEVPAPAPQGPVVHDGTRVASTGREGRSSSEPREPNGWELVSHLTGIVPAIRCISVSELRQRVVAPTLHRCIVEADAHMRITGRERDRHPIDAERDRGEVVAHLSGAVATPLGVAQSELSVEVAAPALH
jgi:hypothetical protein